MQISLLRSESHLLKPNHTSCVTHLFLPPPPSILFPHHPPTNPHALTYARLCFYSLLSAWPLAPSPCAFHK